MKIMVEFLRECAEFKISCAISFNNKNHEKMLKKNLKINVPWK
jgi:hypothetical protein